MEISIYMNFDAKTANKAVFRRVVVCPDALDVKAFVNACKAIFGNDCIIDILFT